MPTLVTGGTGFTGSHLVRRLIERGETVRVLDNQQGLFYDHLKSLGAEITLASVTDKDAVNEAVRGCDVVHHTAAAFRKLNVPDSHYWDVNVEGTRNVCQACKDFGVRRLVYCSTQGVHGDVKTSVGSEESPIAPADYYQETKYNGEEVVQEFVAGGLDANIIRPTAIYGPGDPGRFLILFRLVQRGTFHMFGDGTTHYHPVHIENLVDAFELAAHRQGITGEAFIIGDERSYELNELVREVARAMDRGVKVRYWPFAPLRAAAVVCEALCKPIRVTPPLFPRRVDWFKQHRSFDVGKARRMLGYEPRVDLATGLKQTGEWYRQNGYLVGNPAKDPAMPPAIMPPESFRAAI
ncbi:MAG: NAD-dependent epimerase/dehydratase family protein [Phycisphaera sp.]|nr:MAG: NAD-dependent epimerase/dehydratase family protein [Phycisphaera sp.]